MQDQTTILQCRLKCSIIKDLFSQMMKNTKSANTFYINLSNAGIKMVFMQKDKQVEIFVCLSKEMFQFYSFAREAPYIGKYDIKDLDLIGTIFQNQSSILQMNFKEQGIKIWHSNQFSGQLVYKIQAHEIMEDLPQQVTSVLIMPNDEDQHTKVQLNKMKNLSIILHTLSLQKIQNMELHFRSVHQQIQIVPLPQMVSSNNPIQNSSQVYTLKAKYIKTQMLQHLRFNVKRFKTCLGLFDKNNKIIISFYQNYAKIEVVDKQKKNVQIVLACLADI